MADLFTPIIKKVLDLGFGNLFIFIFTLAVVYAIFRKAKFLGESEVVNGILSFIIAFAVAFWFPLLTGVSLLTSITLLFTQAMGILLFLIIAFLFASFFYPDLPKMLAEQFTRRTVLYEFIAVAIALFVTSALATTLFVSLKIPGKSGGNTIPASIIDTISPKIAMTL